MDYKSFEYLKKEQIAKSWDKEQQDILQIWAERASGWAWLHDKSTRYYRSQADKFTYTSIIFNTVAGGIGFLGNMNDYLPYIIAIMNIISAMLSSLQKFLRSTEKSEAHALYSKIFSSFTRKITLELSLNPKDRRECIEFCKQCRDEYDKAVTDCPLVPQMVIEWFKVEFKHEKNKPEIANGLFHFSNYSRCEKAETHDDFEKLRFFMKWKNNSGLLMNQSIHGVSPRQKSYHLEYPPHVDILNNFHNNTQNFQNNQNFQNTPNIPNIQNIQNNQKNNNIEIV